MRLSVASWLMFRTSNFNQFDIIPHSTVSLGIVEKMSCLAEMSPVGNRIRLENWKVVFKPSSAEISGRDKC